jgi:hypothetical protein
VNANEEAAFRRGFIAGTVGVLLEDEAVENDQTPEGRAENDGFAERLYHPPKAKPETPSPLLPQRCLNQGLASLFDRPAKETDRGRDQVRGTQATASTPRPCARSATVRNSARTSWTSRRGLQDSRDPVPESARAGALCPLRRE